MRRSWVFGAVLGLVCTQACLAQVIYSVTDLDTLPGLPNSSATGINNLGDVIGFSYGSAPGSGNAFLWSAATGLIDLGSFSPVAINDNKTVLGSEGELWAPVTGLQTGLIDTSNLPGSFVSMMGINNAGQVVGSTLNTGFIWTQATGAQPLYTPNGQTSQAAGINNVGQVAGTLSNFAGRLSYVWNGQTQTIIPPIPNSILGQTATAINDFGHVAGYSFISTNYPHAFAWTGGSTTADLGVLPGGTQSFANSINAFDTVVGRSDNGSGQAAFVRTAAGGMQNLNNLLDSNSTGWQLTSANGINNAGQIVGQGIHNGDAHAFLATPASLEVFNPPPPAKIILDFSDRAPFQVVTSTGSFIPIQHNDVNLTSTSDAASKLTTSDQNAILQGVRDIFAQSGVSNVDVEIGHAEPDAKVVYFTDKNANLHWAGYTIGGLNRFNTSIGGSAIVYSVTNYLEGQQAPAATIAGGQLQDINTAVHELGHTFGLRHVEPLPQVIGGTTYYEVMAPTQYNTINQLQSLRFLNAITAISGENVGNLVTHNPIYYLDRYIDGIPDGLLQANGIHPGVWDNPSFPDVLVQLGLGTAGNEGLTLYNVNITADVGADDAIVLAHFEQIGLVQLATMQFQVPLGETFSLTASSTQGTSDADIALAHGDPTNLNNLMLSTDIPGDVQLQLVNSSGYSTLAELSVTSTDVPEPPISLLAYILLVLTGIRRRISSC